MVAFKLSSTAKLLRYFTVSSVRIISFPTLSSGVVRPHQQFSHLPVPGVFPARNNLWPFVNVNTPVIFSRTAVSALRGRINNTVWCFRRKFSIAERDGEKNPQDRVGSQSGKDERHDADDKGADNDGNANNGNINAIEAWLKEFNAGVIGSPMTYLTAFTGVRFLSWYSLFGLMTFSGIFAPGPELAFGFLIAKVTGKFRQPANMALAPSLIKLYPFLGRIHAAAFMGLVDPAATTGKKDEGAPAASALSKMLTDAVNRYGFALFVAGKVNVALTIVVSAMAIQAGIDLPSILSGYGISTSMQDGAGFMALATLVNTLFLPIHVLILPAVVELYEENDPLKSVKEKVEELKKHAQEAEESNEATIQRKKPDAKTKKVRRRFDDEEE